MCAVTGIDGCLERIMEIPGARSVTLVDGASGLAIASAGSHELVDQHEDAAVITDVVRGILGCSALAAERGGGDIYEIIVCGTGGFHLLNLIDGDFDGRLLVHVLCAEDTGNLAIARFRLRAVLGEFSGDRGGD
ncbi:hypothetical protein GCM10027088_40920 [Nocardia goodfellowii]